mmetsp:Transcript_68322/g.134114  ORF Transcript_68322/g.134114 Transcript_68322/m.134114 type:complete len:203 (+) Transcript_68322:83-691(+)
MDSDLRPLPPTPRSSALPCGCRNTRLILDTCSIASMNITKCMGCFDSALYSAKYSSIKGCSSEGSWTSSYTRGSAPGIKKSQNTIIASSGCDEAASTFAAASTAAASNASRSSSDASSVSGSTGGGWCVSTLSHCRPAWDSSWERTMAWNQLRSSSLIKRSQKIRRHSCTQLRAKLCLLSTRFGSTISNPWKILLKSRRLNW